MIVEKTASFVYLFNTLPTRGKVILTYRITLNPSESYSAKESSISITMLYFIIPHYATLNVIICRMG